MTINNLKQQINNQYVIFTYFLQRLKDCVRENSTSNNNESKNAFT